MGENAAAEGLNEIGVELVGGQDIWGIEFPSYDRQEGAPPAPRLKDQNPQIPAVTATSSSQESKELIEGDLPRLTQQVEAAGEDATRLFQEKPEELIRPVDLLTQPNLQSPRQDR